jgi:ferrochelatase
MAGTGILLTAFGGPRDIGGVEPFMASILGCAPPQAVLDETRSRYAALGGASPLGATAQRIAEKLERELGLPVAVGMLHSEPSIEAGVAALVSLGVDRVVHAPLSPFESASTTGAYRAALGAAVREHAGLTAVEAGEYRCSEPFLSVLSDALCTALGALQAHGRGVLVAFTAHSLPVAEVERDTSYVEQLCETAGEVAARSGLGPADGSEALPGLVAFGGHGATPWLLAFQSKGRRGGEWVGPDLDGVIDAAAANGFGGIVASPIGFAVDHMETLYDLDVAAAGRARAAGMDFSRATAPNDDERMVHALADAVDRVL